jgi:hypothetical protein
LAAFHGCFIEPKLDGFRCLIRTEGTIEARSRRFWTPLLPETTWRSRPSWVGQWTAPASGSGWPLA